ncbi:hypothetical protein AOZ06_44935 [Kibdelosporangium phytohabitans]|uniref:Uncharacterized protein n=1 Tax=Kibdelosporangium phytohabitans TaxID=860235 RepID=A0A0N9IE65_9PSEU|nr:hypothetical protein AOZ06_44935 [Kibdelosporangium phytohabitans]
MLGVEFAQQAFDDPPAHADAAHVGFDRDEVDEVLDFLRVACREARELPVGLPQCHDGVFAVEQLLRRICRVGETSSQQCDELVVEAAVGRQSFDLHALLGQRGPQVGASQSEYPGRGLPREAVPFGELGEFPVLGVAVEVEVGDTSQVRQLQRGLVEHVRGRVPRLRGRGMACGYVDVRPVQPGAPDLGVDVGAQHAAQGAARRDGQHGAFVPFGLDTGQLVSDFLFGVPEETDVVRGVGLQACDERHDRRQIVPRSRADFCHDGNPELPNGCAHLVYRLVIERSFIYRGRRAWNTG